MKAVIAVTISGVADIIYFNDDHILHNHNSKKAYELGADYFAKSINLLPSDDQLLQQKEALEIINELKVEYHIARGECLYRINNLNDALKAYTAADKLISPQLNKNELKITNYTSIGKCHFLKGDYYNALNMFSNALALSPQASNDPSHEMKKRASLLYDIGQYYYKLGKYSDAMATFKIAVDDAIFIRKYNNDKELELEAAELETQIWYGMSHCNRYGLKAPGKTKKYYSAALQALPPKSSYMLRAQIHC